MTQKIVERAKTYESDTVPIEDPAQLTTPCPKCGKTVVENYRRFACSSCDFSIPKHPGSRSLEVEEVEELLGKGTIGPMSGFISKMGRPFSAVLKLTPEYKLEFDFGQASDDGASDEAVDFTGQQPLGPCPKCGGRVFEQPMNYLCELATGPAKTCDFRSGKVILQQPIERAQMEKLLNEGRTDVLRAFISNRTRRKFSAFLVRKPDGTVGFEFEPRAKTAAKAPARARAAAPEEQTPAPAARTTKSASRTAAAGGEDVSPAKTTRATVKRAGKVAAKKPAKSAAKRATKTSARKATKSAG
jgi:DNA topoisomerase III